MLNIGDFARLGQVSPRTLRHYGEIGLLQPAHVDAATGYRWYELQQLADLRRVLALRDLGVGLDEIRRLVTADGGVSLEQLRGMLRLRHAQISDTIAVEQDRLRRVARYLDAIERGDVMRSLDIVVKHTEPVRMAEAVGVAPGYGYQNIQPIFGDLLHRVWRHAEATGFEPWTVIAYYDWPDTDGNVLVHVGCEIGEQPVEDTDEVRVVELPVVEVAATMHQGPLDDISDTYEAVVRWIDAGGYRIVDRCREITLAWDEDDRSKNVVEMQFPIEVVSTRP